jgi:hypothetical protein
MRCLNKYSDWAPYWITDLSVLVQFSAQATELERFNRYTRRRIPGDLQT